MTGRWRVALLALHLLEQLEAGHLRQPEVEHHAVERRLLVERRERLLGRADGDDLDVAVAADQLDDRLPLRLVVLDDEQAPDVALDEGLDPAERLVERLVRRRLLEVGDRAGARARGGSSPTPETMCTGMWRVAGCRLSRSSTVQPSMPGRLMSSTIASGRNSRASASPVSPRSATMPLKPCSRAIASTVRAKSASSSTISTTRSPGSIASRSSATSLGSEQRSDRTRARAASPLPPPTVGAASRPAPIRRSSSAPVSAGECAT